MLKIECKGLTPPEVFGLRDYLKTQDGVQDVKLDIKLEGYQTRSGFGNVTPEQIWLVVTTAALTSGGSVILPGVKAASEEAGKDIYKAVKDWLTKNRKSESQAVLYGADGKLIKK